MEIAVEKKEARDSFEMADTAVEKQRQTNRFVCVVSFFVVVVLS